VETTRVKVEVTPEMKAKFKQFVVEVVGRALKEPYSKGTIDKEGYKKICRKCTHAIVEKEQKKNGSFSVHSKKEAAIASFAKSFFESAQKKKKEKERRGADADGTALSPNSSKKPKLSE
jgi:hypothetical protein